MSIKIFFKNGNFVQKSLETHVQKQYAYQLLFFNVECYSFTWIRLAYTLQKSEFVDIFDPFFFTNNKADRNSSINVYKLPDSDESKN